jgi:hypothetical protein
MNTGTKAGLASLLKGAAWLLFAIAAFAFWVGGRAINEFAGTERITAEVEGVGLAALFGLIGAIAKTASTHLEEGDGNISSSDSLRK